MRIDATNTKSPEWRRFLFPCDCNDGTYLEVEWWEDEPTDEFPGYIDITPTMWGLSLWARVKGAVRLVFGQKYYGTGVVLDNDTINELVETINASKVRKGKENGEVQQADTN
jgi:hypothetical protein